MAKLYHDAVHLDGGPLDEVFHIFFDLRDILSLALLVTIPILLWHLSRGIGENRARAVIAGITWAVIGCLAVFAAAAGSDFLQAEYNNDAYKRVTPDDYLVWIGPRDMADPAVLSILDRPHAFDDYGWTRMTVTELVIMVLMACAAAGTLYALRRRHAVFRVLAVPVSLLVMLNLYLLVFAPWAYHPDYDYFIGDRVLGSMADTSFILYSDDVTAGTAMFPFLVSLVVFSWLWRPQRTA